MVNENRQCGDREDLPVGVCPFEQEGEHCITHGRENKSRHIIITISHQGDKVQDSKEPLPRFPVHRFEDCEWKSMGEWASKDGRSKSDEAGEFVAEFGSVSQGEREEADSVALRMTYECYLVVTRGEADPVYKSGQVVHCEFANSPIYTGIRDGYSPFAMLTPETWVLS